MSEILEIGRVNERLKQLESREDKQDGAIEDLRKVGAGIREELAGMRGELRGALWASKLSGAVIGSLVGIGGSGAIALVVYLLNRKP